MLTHFVLGTPYGPSIYVCFFVRPVNRGINAFNVGRAYFRRFLAVACDRATFRASYLPETAET